MARVNYTVSIEMDALRDAFGEVARVFELLGRRHGQRFRDLERRIEGLGALGVEAVVVHSVGDNLVPIIPAIGEVLKEARTLGVI